MNNIAIVGAGYIGKLHANVIRSSCPTARIVAVVEEVEQKGKSSLLNAGRAIIEVCLSLWRVRMSIPWLFALLLFFMKRWFSKLLKDVKVFSAKSPSLFRSAKLTGWLPLCARAAPLHFVDTCCGSGPYM